MQLLRHWGKVRDYDQPAVWVRRVAIRLAVRSAQRERRIVDALSRIRPDSEADVSARVEQHSDVLAALARLTTVAGAPFFVAGVFTGKSFR